MVEKQINGKYICICGRFSKYVINLLLFFITINEFMSFASICIYITREF